MVELLNSKCEPLAAQALKFVGGILGSENTQVIEKCMFNAVIDKLTNLCYSTRHCIVKECCWAFSNLCASGPSYCEQFVKSYAFQRCLALALNDNNDIRNEALWALTNAITEGSDQTMRDAFLSTTVNYDDEDKTHILNVLLTNITVKDQRLVCVIIEALYKLLKTDEFFKL